MRRHDDDNEYFALVMLDVRTAFFDIQRILQVDTEKHSDNDVLFVVGRNVRDKVTQALRQGVSEVTVIPTEDATQQLALAELVEVRQRYSHVLAERLDRYLEKHFQKKTLSLGDLRENFQISSSYITRLFREHVGMSFRKRLNSYRVQKAKYLLRTTDQTVDCIANEVGFRNHARLTEALYRFEGMPPGRFRRMCVF